MAGTKPESSALPPQSLQPLIHGDNAVEERLLDDSVTGDHKSEKRRWLSRQWRDLSKAALTLLLGTMILLTVCGFLGFIWFGGPDGPNWRRIMSSNWTTRSVALSSLLIRWTVSAQAVLCTSLLAANFLAKGVSIEHILRMATIRYNTSGPWDILTLLLDRQTGSLHWSLVGLTLAIGWTSLVSQFTSTILLSDLSQGPIRGSSNTSHAAIAFENGTLGDAYVTATTYDDPFLTGQSSYPLFAEDSHPEKASQIADIDDTGPVIRALLPVSTESGRANLLDFEGNATLVDARVVCSRPHFGALVFEGTGSDGSLHLTGQVQPSGRVPELIVGPSSNSSFNCSLSKIPDREAFGDADPGWITTICRLADDAGGLLSSLDPAFNTSLHYYFDEYWWAHELDGRRYVPDLGGSAFEMAAIMSDPTKPIQSVPLGLPYLVLNYTNTTFTWEPQYPKTFSAFSFNVTDGWTSTSHGAWSRLSTENGHGLIIAGDAVEPALEPVTQLLATGWNWWIDASICYTALFDTRTFPIAASRSQAAPEPAEIISGVRQLGVTNRNLSYDDRQILSLDRANLSQHLAVESGVLRSGSLPPKSHYDRVLPVYTAWGTNYYDYNMSRMLFPTDFSPDANVRTVSESHIKLFQHIIQETRSPARALQALIHTVLTDGYYRYLPAFDMNSAQTLSYSIIAIQPVRAVGFWIVIANLTVHIFLVSIVTVGFSMRSAESSVRSTTALSSISNAWQAHAQIMSPDLEEILRDPAVTTAVDRDVWRALKRHGRQDEIFVLDEADGGEGVRFKAKTK